MLGGTVGFIFAFLIANDYLTQRFFGTQINWMWRMPLATFVSLVAGYIFSLFFSPYKGARLQEIKELTISR
jgi:hypothetical protein